MKAVAARKAGGCLCGAVRFTAQDVPAQFDVCHCEMCRRWTGSAMLGVSVPTENVAFEDETRLSRIQSSAWAERAFCSLCGTGIFFRVTQEGDWFGKTELPIGLFDDQDGFEMTSEIYIDHKPDSFSYAGTGRKTMTRQQCVDMFGVLDSE